MHLVDKESRKVVRKAVWTLVGVLALFAAVIILVASVSDYDPNREANNFPREAIVNLGGHQLYSKIAENAFERSRGLSGVQSLKDNESLVFVFEEPTIEEAGIWMKGMNFPLDIIYIDDAGLVNTIYEDVKPDTYPTVYYPNAPAKYVVEVKAGFVKKAKVNIGSPFLFTELEVVNAKNK